MPPADSNDRPPVVLTRLLIVVCLACDFLMMPILATVQGRANTVLPLVLTIVGCVLAQGCLLAAWLAWSERPFWQRLTAHWIVAAFLFVVWAAGVALSGVSLFSKVSYFVGLSVPLVSIAAQVPLWIARQSFGWRLTRRDVRYHAGRATLSIRDLMLATVLVAVALALARLAPSPDGKPIGDIWIVMFAVATTISAITLLPAGPLLLRTQPLQRGVVFAALYAASWVALVWLVVLIAWDRGLFTPPPVALLVGLSFLILSFAATVISAAAAARARGYRLVWGRANGRSVAP